MSQTSTQLPDADVLAEYAIAAAENARRLLTDAENLLRHGGWPSAYSLAVLAFEEVGKAWLSVVGLIMPGELRAEFPVGKLVASHRDKLQAARMIAPWLAFITRGPDAVGAGLIEALDAMEGQAREDDLGKQRGFYVDCTADGTIWSPMQVKRDEARRMVATVRDVLDRSAPLTEPDFLRFIAAPPDDARADLDGFLSRFIACLQDDDSEAGFAMLAEMHSLMPGVGQMYEDDVRRIALSRARPPRTQPQKLSKARRRGKAAADGR